MGINLQQLFSNQTKFILLKHSTSLIVVFQCLCQRWRWKMLYSALQVQESNRLASPLVVLSITQLASIRAE